MIVETHDLWKRFTGTKALRGLDLAVPEGSAYALVGANGAGKSTALRIVANLIQASSGSATVMGVDSRRLRPQHFQRIGYVAENQVLPSRMKVRDYFDYTRRFYDHWDLALEQDLRRELELPPDRRIGALSRGMRMKLALAGALPFRPKLLILDEPLGGLDATVRDDFLGNLLGRMDETTVIICSHELHDIEHAITHLGVMHEGRLLFQDSMQDLEERVKQVRITFEGAAPVPRDVPREWLQMQAQGHVLTYVDTQFPSGATQARIATYPGVSHVHIEALSLRGIFTAYARSARSDRVAEGRP